MILYKFRLAQNGLFRALADILLEGLDLEIRIFCGTLDCIRICCIHKGYSHSACPSVGHFSCNLAK